MSSLFPESYEPILGRSSGFSVMSDFPTKKTSVSDAHNTRWSLQLREQLLIFTGFPINHIEPKFKTKV